MSERDKLIAQAEALEQYAVEWQHAADDAGIPPVHMFSAMYVAEDVREEAAKLRALADQQPVEEPHGIITASDGRVAWLKGMPPIGTNIYTRPQSSAPAAPADADLDALVARLRETHDQYNTDTRLKAAQALIDQRTQVNELEMQKVRQHNAQAGNSKILDAFHQRNEEQSARITRLEADHERLTGWVRIKDGQIATVEAERIRLEAANAEARELLEAAELVLRANNFTEAQQNIRVLNTAVRSYRAFLAKQGD